MTLCYYNRIEALGGLRARFTQEPPGEFSAFVLDLKKATILLAIEPHEGFELADILETADDAAATLRWR